MAYDTVVLSPECVGINRREGLALESITTGTFISAGVGGFSVTAAAVARQYVAIENIATAQDTAYVYTTGENVFATILPAGCRVKVVAAAATYAEGDVVELAAGGIVTALAAGVAVGVVPVGAGATVGAGETLIIDLL